MLLQTLTVLASDQHHSAIRAFVLEGRIQEAVACAEDLLGDEGAPLSSDTWSSIAACCGDLMLTLDRSEEAEEMYRQSVRAASKSPERGATRLASCRATGFMSLYQRRFGVAAACFARIAEDECSSVAQKAAALCSLALTQHHLGQRERVQQSLRSADELASQDGSIDLAMLVRLIRSDISVQGEIRAHEALQDHVFWRSPATPQVRTDAHVQPLAGVEECLQSFGHHPFVAQRLEHARDLLLASFGDGLALANLTERLMHLHRAGLAALERQARIETALVAISVRKPELARASLEPLQGRDGTTSVGQRWNMEFLYCMAKVCVMTGRMDDSMRLYQRYALESMQCVRAESAPVDARHSTARTSSNGGSDEMEMQLPAKYRRAYRYMIERLDCAELSIREIADNIGVTERALQLAFRSHLGLSPGELLQRCRVERIRADLLSEGKTEATVFETAARWGIRNRSTLASSYRKYFRETPTQTLARRGAALAVS